LKPELISQRLEQDIANLKRATSRPVFQAIILRGAVKVGVKAEEIAGGYPERQQKELPRFYTRLRADGSSYQSKFKTTKQQRYVMWLVSSGKIPRKRTGALGASITSEPRQIESATVINVGSNLFYAPYVIGDEESDPPQSHYHAGVWTPLSQNLSDNIPALITVLENELAAGLAAVL
jgi:hypothetical protein